MMRKYFAAFAGLSAGVVFMTMMAACSVDSANSVIRSVNARIEGIYRNSETNQNGGRFVSANTGNSVNFLNVRQAGDQLEAIDNNGIIFRGTIGNVSDNAASFSLEGNTTAGNAVLISGNVEIGSGQGTMRATWIEDSLFGTVYGTANGPTIITNTPINTNTNGIVGISLPGPLLSDEEIIAYRKSYLWFSES